MTILPLTSKTMSKKFGQKAKVNGVIYLRMEGVLATFLGYYVSRIIVNIPMQRKAKMYLHGT